MALTNATQDFIIKNGVIVLGQNPVTDSVDQNGALQVYGGAAIAQNLIVGTTGTFGDALFVTTTATIGQDLSVGSSATIAQGLTVGGPATFNKTINVANTATLQDLTVQGALNVAGGITLTGNLSFSGTSTFSQNIIVNSTLSSLATISSNAIYIRGGVGIDKNLVVGGPVLFKDVVTFNGTATNVLSSNTYYTDNLIELHVPSAGVYTPWLFDDGKDIGFRFHYFNGTDTNAALVLSDSSKYLEWFSTGAESTLSNFTSATYGTFKTGAVKLVSGTASLGSTNTGDLTVVGGVGIWRDITVGSTATISGPLTVNNSATVTGSLTVNGTIFGTVTTATFATTATTAVNLAGGAPGSLPYQSATGTTVFLPIGSNGTLLTVAANSLTWASASGSTVGFALTSTNLLSGTTGAVPFQAAPGVTAFDGARFFYTNSGTNTATLNLENLAISGSSIGTFNGTGALSVVGGAYFGQQVYIGGTGTGGLTVAGASSFGGTVTLTGSINGVSTGLGTLVLSNGGIYVRQDVYSGGTVSANNIQNRNLGGNNLIYSDATGFLQNAQPYYNTATNIIVGTITQSNNLNGGATGTIPFQSTSSATTFDLGNLYYTSSTLFTPNLNVASSATINGDLYVDGTIYIQGVGVDTITSTTGSFRDVVSTGSIYANNITATNVFAVAGTFTNLSVQNTLTSNDVQTSKLEVSGLTTLGNTTATNVTVTNLTVTGLSTIGSIGFTNATANNLTVTNVLTVGNLVTSLNGIFTGTVTIANLTVTNTVTTNSLIGNSIVGTVLQSSNTLSVTNTATLGNIISTSTQDAISTTTASIVSSGGIASAKGIYAGGPITVGATLSSPGNVVPALYSNNTLVSSYTSNTISGTGSVNLDSYNATTYRTARYTVQVVDQVNVATTSCHITEMTVFHDGANVYINEYGTSTNNGELGGFGASLTSGQVVLTFTPVGATSMTIKVVRFGITA